MTKIQHEQNNNKIIAHRVFSFIKNATAKCENTGGMRVYRKLLNQKLTSYLLCLTLSIFLPACFNTSKLVKKRPSDPSQLSKVNIDGIYENVTYANSIKFYLWNILYECSSFKQMNTQQDDNSKVRLTFDGNKKLIVTLLNNNNIVGNFKLDVKVIDNYLSVKRNLFLIPIPILFYLHDETKVVLSIDKSGQLDVKYGTKRSFCLVGLMNGHKNTYNPKYNKLGN